MKLNKKRKAMSIDAKHAFSLEKINIIDTDKIKQAINVKNLNNSNNPDRYNYINDKISETDKN